MILSHTTMIAAPAGRIFAFFDRMEENYTRWHPDHITFRWLQEGRQAVGNRFYFEEHIHGQHLKRTMRYSKVEHGRLIEFVPDSALIRFFLKRVSFIIEPTDGQCRFTQEVQVLSGPIGRRLNRKGFAAVEKHMREEGQNLKAIMEADERPSPA
ncbi:SRPBCC family protein [Roseinatronobacter alkalisoli]|uniref:SRPBCC family protein n=1 Tax=Roseinatronobacter alkalisoli TaxID=3028235 RepID=A0ABT5TCG3_9RHOB|nr:SRPBCC family protein [Roseinatronobacter sp. HJB301]MDD7972823.1 SRPBCC family protein [Roseinatronobacter sp. HJB301]